jgi:hypothetical protein
MVILQRIFFIAGVRIKERKGWGGGGSAVPLYQRCRPLYDEQSGDKNALCALRLLSLTNAKTTLSDSCRLLQKDRLFLAKKFAVHVRNDNNDLPHGDRMTEFKLNIRTFINLILHLFRNVVGCSAILI